MTTSAYPPLWKGPDKPGQRVPRKFSALSWLQHPVLKQVYAEFDREVPPDFWSEDAEAERSVAIISCPCGAEPQVSLHTTEFCSGCDRVFWFLGDKVLVAKDPSRAEDEPAEEESSADGRRLGGSDEGKPTTDD